MYQCANAVRVPFLSDKDAIPRRTSANFSFGSRSWQVATHKHSLALCRNVGFGAIYRAPVVTSRMSPIGTSLQRALWPLAIAFGAKRTCKWLFGATISALMTPNQGDGLILISRVAGSRQFRL